MNGCKYPGTPEPCEGYRELEKIAAELAEAAQFVGDDCVPIEDALKARQAVLRLRQYFDTYGSITKDIDQLREKK